jgi:hypothetical protein
MKSKIFIVLIFFINGLCLAQQNTFNKDVELQKFVERGGKAEETSPNIYNLQYRDGTQRVFNFNQSEMLNNKIGDFNTTIINVWEIDTTLYANKFSFWQDVKVVNDPEGRVYVDDINKNGLLELYGITEANWPFGGQVDILEQDSQGIFHTIYSYDSTSIFVQGIGDIDSDGINEIHLRTTDTLNGKFYKADSLGALPTTFDFIFYYYPNQIKGMTFGDFDQNSITDCAFVDGSNPSKVIISEYRDTTNNFTTLFEMPTEGDVPSILAIGDFDQDRKTELAFGTVLQKAYVIEVVDTNQYSLVWQGFAPTYNAYMITETDDIDGNGKPEFWIGGQDFNTGITTFWCFEADGDNNYIPVAAIELRYLVSISTFYIQSSDMDNDGKEELVINLGNYLLILKFTGKPNQQSYELYYAKIDEQSQPGVEFQPVTVFDFNNDAKKDILLPMVKYVNLNLFSYILVQNDLSSVNERDIDIVEGFNIEQNYPNPFNLSSQIKVISKLNSKVKVIVYDILGKEVRTLLDKELPAGEYTIEWDGKDSNGNILNSGVYFIRMLANPDLSGKANSFQKTIKSILMK